MTLSPALRKLSLTVHVAASVGWLGAVVVYLFLAVTALRLQDPVAAAFYYPVLKLLGGWVIVPFSLAALASGVVLGFGTSWGLVRHYWVLVKLVLTFVGTAVLLKHLSAIGQMADLARAGDLTSSHAGLLRLQLVVHAAGGLVVLLITTVLSVYKPWGKIRRSQALNGEGFR